jgi:hypothetical protein
MKTGDWSRWWALPANDRLALGLAFVWLPLTGLGLRWLGFKRMQDRVASSAHLSQSPPEYAVERARTLSRWVGVAARRGMARGTCLTQSLTLLRLLQREGVMGQLRIGVRLQAGQLDAHAWVEVDGQPVNDSPDVTARYAAYDHTRPFDSRSFR